MRILGSAGIHGTFHNPSTGTKQLKHTCMLLRDDIVFGSGYFVLDARAQTDTVGNVLLYNTLGAEAAFAQIGASGDARSTYVFVADPETGTTLAQNADPALLGMSDWDTITSILPVDDILAGLRTGSGIWAGYPSTTPVTGETEDKRTWLIIHDGLVFGSGYYLSNWSMTGPCAELPFLAQCRIR